VELLMAMVLSLVVIGGAVAVFTTSIRSEPRVSSRGADIQRARTAMERITRELRQGWEVPVASASQIQILTYANSATCGGASSDSAIPCRVTYTCSAGACVRLEQNPDGSGSGSSRTFVSGLSGAEVFSYSPGYVGVTLVFPAAEGEDAITLQDGVSLRNPGPPS
jgi:Tfp pilus assembly protein PilW